MSSLKIYVVCLLLIFLSACSLFQPFADRRRNPGTSDINQLYKGESKPYAPVICYNPLFTNSEELQQMADEICINEETGDKAELVDKNYIGGKLLLPVRAYFRCVKKGMENVEEKEDESVTGK